MGNLGDTSIQGNLSDYLCIVLVFFVIEEHELNNSDSNDFG